MGELIQEEKILLNIQKILLPLVERIRLRYRDDQDIQMLKKGLENITSDYGKKISSPKFKLTRRELEICNMIHNGLVTKQIASEMNISAITVERHRNNIRKKFGITRQSIKIDEFMNKL